MKIFNPSYQINIFNDWLDKSDDKFEPTDQLEQALLSDFTIAAVPYMFDQFDQYKQNPFDYSKFDLLLISDIEHAHPGPILEWLKKLKIKNYLFAIGSLFENAPLSWIYRPWWSFNIINRNNFQEIKSEEPLYEFDILLGGIKPHRNFLMAKLQNSTLFEQSIVTYRSVFNVIQHDMTDPRDIALNKEIQKILSGKNLLYSYVSKNLDPSWEVSGNVSYNVSDIVPWKIYQHTKYSVVCETNYRDREFFLTEKTAKAFFAKRLFVVFSCHHYLKKIKELGFKTFDGLIDESYDNESDSVKRFHMVFEQLNYLAAQDYRLVNEKSKSIREHNHNHLIKYYQEIKCMMRKAVYNKIEEIKNANSIQ